MDRIRQTIKDAERKNHPASLGLALSWALDVRLTGDFSGAEEHAERLSSHAEVHALGPLSCRRTRLQGYAGCRPG